MANNDGYTPFDSPSPAADTLTIAGHTVVSDPTGMIIAGSSVLPGGSAVTISNTLVSLDPSGILVVGSSKFSLPPQSVFTIAFNHSQPTQQASCSTARPSLPAVL